MTITTSATAASRLWARAALVGFVVVGAVVLVVAVGASGGTGLPAWQAVVLGAVEGLTEYLPISSTGHLLITGRLFGLGDGSDGSALGTYVIAIQVGAIAAVLSLYHRRVGQIVRGLMGHDDPGRRLFLSLAVAFAPAALFGAAFGPVIKDRLFGPWPIVAAWAVGGIVLLVWQPPDRRSTIDIVAVTARQALIIGVAQVAALWPGTSRSLVTLIAALAVGLTLSAAVEFSFLLGLATLTAATTWDLARNGPGLIDAYGWTTPLLGAVVAFVTAVASIRWMTNYLRRHPLRAFGAYRLAIAATTATLVLTGAI